MAIDVLNSKVGIADVLPAASNEHLPTVDDFNSVGQSQSLSEVTAYKSALESNGFNIQLASTMRPVINSEDIVRPTRFNNLLNSAQEKLSQVENDANLRRFVREDLAPLAQNRELLNAYLGMMVGG